MENQSSQLNRQQPSEDIAIIGMACIFPGAPDLVTYWDNILHKVDSIIDAPPDWDFELSRHLHEPDSNSLYCRKGGFLTDRERRFDPFQYGVIPTGIDGAEPDQFLSLKVAAEALADAGYADTLSHRNRTAVILGRGSYVNAGLMNLVQHSWVIDQTVSILHKLHPEFTPAELRKLHAALTATLPPLRGETVPGFVPSIAAGRIANRLDLMGPNFIVDAACASSLIAVDSGMRLLRQGECDLALVGGIQGGNTVLSYHMFCLINALSQKSCIRPFDQEADGTILGEGLGLVLLKRCADAERDGDRIYALIKSIGIASDGRALGLLAPRLEGVELALQRAYETAGVSPETIGLLEAHGTGTPAGDTTELEALQHVFGGKRRSVPDCALGSVKSMIGHTLGAAGIAGLIKVALALYHKVLPPTLNCDTPNPALDLEQSPFYINTSTRPWIHGSATTPRRAGVNALGFGGINSHAILEEYQPSHAAGAVGWLNRWSSELIVLQAASRAELIERSRRLRAYVTDNTDINLKDLAYTLNCPLIDSSLRLAVVVDSLEDLSHKLERASQRLGDSNCRQIKDRKGIYFFENPLGAGAKLALLFPGEGSQYQNMLADLCLHLPEIRECFDRTDRLFLNHPRGFVLSDVIFPPPFYTASAETKEANRIWSLESAVEAVLTANEAIYQLISHLGIHPDAVLGHSTGEYSAMRVAGVMDLLDDSHGTPWALELNAIHVQLAAEDKIPRAVPVSVGASSKDVQAILDRLQAPVYLGMDNCPHQTVIMGEEAAIKEALSEFNKQGLICQELPFDRPYHCPLFEPYTAHLRQFFERRPLSLPSIPLYSCTTGGPCPSDPEALCRIAVEHWVRPVEFRQTIERMYADGIQIFIEAGAKGMLTSFVDDTLRGQDYLAVASNSESRSAIEQLHHMVGLLSAHGVKMNLDYLYAHRSPQRLPLDEPAGDHDTVSRRRSLKSLTLHLPKLDLTSESTQLVVHQAIPANSDSAVGTRYGEEPLAASAFPPTLDRVPHPNYREPLPASTLPLPAVEPQSAEVASSVMESYLQTMNLFLETQQEVMQTFLDTERLPSE